MLVRAWGGRKSHWAMTHPSASQATAERRWGTRTDTERRAGETSSEHRQVLYSSRSVSVSDIWTPSPRLLPSSPSPPFNCLRLSPHSPHLRMRSRSAHEVRRQAREHARGTTRSPNMFVSSARTILLSSDPTPSSLAGTLRPSTIPRAFWLSRRCRHLHRSGS